MALTSKLTNRSSQNNNKDTEEMTRRKQLKPAKRGLNETESGRIAKCHVFTSFQVFQRQIGEHKMKW
jgi:hypothetical protein